EPEADLDVQHERAAGALRPQVLVEVDPAGVGADADRPSGADVSVEMHRGRRRQPQLEMSGAQRHTHVPGGTVEVEAAQVELRVTGAEVVLPRQVRGVDRAPDPIAGSAPERHVGDRDHGCGGRCSWRFHSHSPKTSRMINVTPPPNMCGWPAPSMAFATTNTPMMASGMRT